MRYRISLPLRSSTDDRRLDIVDPAWSSGSRALAQHGLGDVEAATNAMLLALFDDCHERLSFVDLGADIGVSSMLCARLFRPKQVVAVEPCERAASMIRRIAAANELDVALRGELCGALDSVVAGSCLVVRVGPAVDTSVAMAAIAMAPSDEVPSAVIVGDRDRTELVSFAKAAGLLAYPLERFPTWRPLRSESDTAPADGWLLTAGAVSAELRERHSIWAGAVGACTPDRNDRRPFMAEFRSGFRRGHRAALLVADAQRDLGRGARAIWNMIDPWLPPPTSRSGRLVGRAVARARQVLPAPNGL